MFMESEDARDLKAPEERNVLVIWGERSAPPELKPVFAFSFNKHFLPPGLKPTPQDS
jgi:hypothetical protein